MSHKFDVNFTGFTYSMRYNSRERFIFSLCDSSFLMQRSATLMQRSATLGNAHATLMQRSATLGNARAADVGRGRQRRR